MGVLKVNVGTALAPDWRNIGCGGSAAQIGTLADTFDRANSTTSINPASDGGAWLVDGGTWGIAGNKGYLVATVGGTLVMGQYVFRTNLTAASVDMTVTVGKATGGPNAMLLIAYDPATSTGYQVFFDGTSASGITVRRYSDATTSSNLGSGSLTDFTGSTAVLRVVYSSSTGVLTVRQNGSVILTVTDGSPLTGTWVGMGTSSTASLTTFDSYSVTGSSAGVVGAATTGRLKLWDGTQWVREKCDSDSIASGGVAQATGFDWSTSTYGTQVGGYPSFGSHQGGVTFAGVNNSGTDYYVSWQVDRRSITTGAVDVTWGGTAGSFAMLGSGGGLAVSSIDVGAGYEIAEWRLVDSANLSTVLLRWTYDGTPIAHPLKVWDGTTWQTVACLVPA